ncbi:UNVERIFIED_CONTAM: hypothetical protein K2H54_040755 [Gekko kuhli]
MIRFKVMEVFLYPNEAKSPFSNTNETRFWSQLLLSHFNCFGKTAFSELQPKSTLQAVADAPPLPQANLRPEWPSGATGLFHHSLLCSQPLLPLLGEGRGKQHSSVSTQLQQASLHTSLSIQFPVVASQIHFWAVHESNIIPPSQPLLLTDTLPANIAIITLPPNIAIITNKLVNSP